MKKLLLVIMISIFLISFASAEYLPHQFNKSLNFSITSNFATECQLVNINSPNGILTIDQNGARSGQTFSFGINQGNYTSLGMYCHNIVCTDGVDYTTGKECVEVTLSGNSSPDGFVIVLFIIGFLAIVGIMGGLVISNIGHFAQGDYDISDLIKNVSMYFVLIAFYVLELQYLGNQTMDSILVWIMWIGGFTNVAMSFLAFIISHLRRVMEQKIKLEDE